MPDRACPLRIPKMLRHMFFRNIFRDACAWIIRGLHSPVSITSTIWYYHFLLLLLLVLLLLPLITITRTRTITATVTATIPTTITITIPVTMTITCTSTIAVTVTTAITIKMLTPSLASEVYCETARVAEQRLSAGSSYKNISGCVCICVYIYIYISPFVFSIFFVTRYPVCLGDLAGKSQNTWPPTRICRLPVWGLGTSRLSLDMLTHLVMCGASMCFRQIVLSAAQEP